MKLYIYDSARQGKRFVAIFVKNDIIQFTSNFGSKNGMTFVDHGDIIKRANYLKRHSVNEEWDDPFTAGSLSRWILWGNSDDIETNIKLFKKKFNLE